VDYISEVSRNKSVNQEPRACNGEELR